MNIIILRCSLGQTGGFNRLVQISLRLLFTGFPQPLKIMETLKNHKKISCMEKSWNLKEA